MDIDLPLIELEIGWFDIRADIARIHEMGSNNLPSKITYMKLHSQVSLQTISVLLTHKMSLIKVLKLV